jgi:hypothetical protein
VPPSSPALRGWAYRRRPGASPYQKVLLSESTTSARSVPQVEQSPNSSPVRLVDEVVALGENFHELSIAAPILVCHLRQHVKVELVDFLCGVDKSCPIRLWAR